MDSLILELPVSIGDIFVSLLTPPPPHTINYACVNYKLMHVSTFVSTFFFVVKCFKEEMFASQDACVCRNMVELNIECDVNIIIYC